MGLVDIVTDGDSAVFGLDIWSRVHRFDLNDGREQVTASFRNPSKLGINAQTGAVYLSTLDGMIHEFDRGLNTINSENFEHPVNGSFAPYSGQRITVSNDGLIVQSPSEGNSAVLGVCGQLATKASRRTNRYWNDASGEQVFVACADGTVAAAIDIPGLARLKLEGQVTDVDGSTDGRMLAAAGENGPILIVDTQARSARTLTSGDLLDNIEILASKDVVVVAVDDLPIVASWRISEIAPKYPMNDDQLFNWLHNQGDR